MPVTIPQIQDKHHRVCDNCSFKKVKCCGGDPCSTCIKENKICLMWDPLRDGNATMIRQGTINGYTMQICMMHQALVNIIQSGEVPNVPEEALTTPHALLSAMGMVSNRDDAAWRLNLEQPWAQIASHLAKTHPHDKKPHAKRGSKNTAANDTNKVSKKPAATTKRQRKQASPRPEPACPATPARPSTPVLSAPAQYPGYYGYPPAAPAQQQMGYNIPLPGQAYPPGQYPFDLSGAAPPLAPPTFDDPYYNQQGYQVFPPVVGGQQGHAAPGVPLPTAPAPMANTTHSISPELGDPGIVDEVWHQIFPGEVPMDEDPVQQQQYSGPGEGVDMQDFEMGMDLVNWNQLTNDGFIEQGMDVGV